MVAAEVVAGFDYSGLDSETRIVVQQRCAEVRSLIKRSGADILEIGQKLIEVRDRLKHGKWGVWLQAEFEWSIDTAENYMRVARQFPEIPNGSDFHAKALYLLASPNTPAAARQEAIALAESGQTVSHATAIALVQEHRTPPPRPALFTQGDTVQVAEGEFKGRSVVVDKVEGAVIHCVSEGRSQPFLPNELESGKEAIASKKSQQWAPRDQQQTLMGSYESMLQVEQERCSLLEKQLAALTQQAERAIADLARERVHSDQLCELIREIFDELPSDFQGRAAQLLAISR